jgi:regulator of sirC expression with transglutaminase-like and TPR domain
MDDLAAFQQLAETDERRVDLARAALAIARIEHPALSIELEVARLDDLAARSGAAVTSDRPAALERLLAFLFEDEGFRGNAEEYYDPRNSCLNDVLDRKLGIPITLSVLTMEVGRRVGIDVEGVSLPGHFIVSAQLGARRIFLDPFNRGAVLTPAQAQDVASRAVGRPVKLEEGHWAPCGKRQILVRMLRNLKGIYARREDWPRALAVVDRLLVLDADSPVHVRDRGSVLVRLQRLHEGAEAWDRYLRRFPNAQDADAFREQLRKVRQKLGSLN